MKILLASALLCLLAACDNLDQVKKHYATRSEAEADHLFQRGWLPSVIPLSSVKIITENDLDLNLSSGEFSFDPSEASAFISHLQPAAGLKTPWDINKEVQEKAAKGYGVFTYADSDSRWIFYINPIRGHAYYDLWMLERTANHVVQPMR
jgi:hypothetical protein